MRKTTRIQHSANLLADLPKSQLSHFFARAPLRDLKAGRALFSAGDVGDGCYRVEQGLLKIIATSPQAEERIVAMLGPGSIVGELSAIDGLPRSMSVVAFEDCTLRFVSRENFEKSVQTHPEISRQLMAVLASRLRAADQALTAMSFLTVKGRVARALLDLADHIGKADRTGHIVFRQRIGHREIAAMAGVARENVSRTLSEWQRRKLVVRSSNNFCINNRSALEREMKFAE